MKLKTIKYNNVDSTNNIALRRIKRPAELKNVKIKKRTE